MAIPDIVVSPRTDPLYNAHGYLTKVPVGAIRPFIREFSKLGGTVADVFAGSGMTGVAAVMEGRRAELSDLSVLGRHIGTGFLSSADGDAVEAVGARAIESVRERVGHFYRTERAEDGKEMEWVRTIWSFTYECPVCSHVLNFYVEVTASSKGKIDRCPGCRGTFKKRDWRCVDDVPVSVVLDGVKGKQVEQPVNEHDHWRIEEAKADAKQSDVPSLDIEPEREMYRRSALGKWGLTKTSDFFSARNGLVLLELWREINGVDDQALRQKLLFAFTAILPRASRRYQWSAKRPLNAQNQTYYISPVHFEWNVLDLFARKVRAVRKAQDFRDADLPGPVNEEDWSYRNCSANSLSHLADESIDYVFTDPPFGSNIFYADMNLFQEAWLGKVTHHEDEAVIHTGGRRRAQATERYERIMTEAFQEAFRILKPGACMSVVFGNSKGSVWSMVQRGLRTAGFGNSPIHIALLDKGQRSVKGLASGRETVVTIDLVLTVRKPKEAISRRQQEMALPVDRKALITRAIGRLEPEKALNPSYVYVGAVKEAIRQQIPVDDLHLSDVLVALTEAGYSIDSKTGLLNC